MSTVDDKKAKDQKAASKINYSIHGIPWQNGRMVVSAEHLSPAGKEAARKRRLKNAKKQEQGRKNRMRRAELNATFAGENGSKRAAEYHSALKALSLGTS